MSHFVISKSVPTWLQDGLPDVNSIHWLWSRGTAQQSSPSRRSRVEYPDTNSGIVLWYLYLAAQSICTAHCAFEVCGAALFLWSRSAQCGFSAYLGTATGLQRSTDKGIYCDVYVLRYPDTATLAASRVSVVSPIAALAHVPILWQPTNIQSLRKYTLGLQNRQLLR